MRKLLLNPTPLFRKLRQLSLLLSLLLALPQTAWGDDSTIYNFTGTSDISNKTGTATSNVTGVGERTWTINNFTIFNDQNVIQDITPTAIAGTLGYSNLGYSSYTADFMLESDFGITGAFVSATISYTTNNMSSGEVQVYNANGNYPLTTSQGEGGKTIMDLTKTSVTLSLTNNYDKKYFNNNHISFQFTFKPNSASSSFQITSITITTTPVTFYGITVKGTSVRSDNVSNVLNDDFSSVSYNATTNTLTLKDVDLTYGDDKNINATSALTINLVGYNEVGEINVNDGNSVVELKFTTNETLPGRLKFTNISGNTSIVCENGLSWDNTNKYIKSSSTNPHIIYGFGSYTHGDINGYNNEGGMEELDVSPDVEFKYSTSNTDIKYFKVSSSEKSCYLYPASLDDMNLVTKAYLLFDWGTCTTNNDVTVQIKGLNGDFSNDGTYSDPVSLPSTGGLVEIPLNRTINSYYFQLYFSSSTSEFSFIPISVGFQKATGYGISVAGTPVTSTNATTGITAGNGKVYYNVTDNILTLNGAEITSSGIESSVGNLTIHLTGDNSISGINVAGIKSTNGGSLTFTADASATLHITTTGDAASAITEFANVTMGTGAYLQTDIPTKYDTNGKNFREQVSSANIVKVLNITSTPSYPLWIGNTQFTSASTSIPTGFSFNATGNILTLTNVTQANPLISGLANLTIALSGDNSIIRSDSAAVIRSINSEAALIIQNAGTGDCSLYLENNGSDPSASPVVKNFASVSNGLNYISKLGESINNASTHDAFISSATIYPLWIAATKPVTATTTSGTGWSYDNDNKKLTLNGGSGGNTITGQIISGLGDLKIHITGQNTIKAAGSETNLIKSTNNGVLSFETDATTGNYLYFENSAGEKFGDNSINGFTSVSYEAGLGYYSQFSQIIETLFIGYNNNTYKLHSSNANNIVGDQNASCSYSTNGNVLTLKNANIDVIEWTTDGDLTIALNGTCSVDHPGGTYAINYHGNLNIVKASGATSAELTASTTYHPPFVTNGFTLGSGLYLKPISDVSITITDNPEFVLFNGYAMTNGQTITKTTPAGSLVYTESGSEKTLTFTNFQDAFGDGTTQVNAIETGVVGLKVIFVGNNKITCNDAGAFAFKSFQSNASIQFVKGGDGCKLTMDTKTDNPLSFGSGKVTYDRLIYYSSGANEKYICEPTAPTMVYDQEKVILEKGYPDGDIYYTITYADGKTANVAKTKYTAEFALDAPATVEAWVEVNGATTSTVKGKHFGYQDAPFVMAANETKTPVLIPAFEAGDNIEIAASDPYTSSDTGVATFANGVITAVSSGTATLTTKLAITSGANSSIVILNSNSQFNTTVKVATDISSCFQGQNNYGTYYNTADNYTIPAGMEAYIVTGVSGNQVVLKSLSILPKQTALLLFKGTATSFNSVTTNETADTSENILMHADVTVTTTGKEYILYKDEFVKATETIPSGKCYLQITTNLPARGVLGIGNDGSTAIEGIDVEATEDETWYDLQGRRIQKPTKAGIYIVNGKKVIINNK